MTRERLFANDPMDWFRTGSPRYSPYHWQQMAAQARLAGTVIAEYSLPAGRNGAICIVGVGFGRELELIHNELSRSNESLPRFAAFDIHKGRLIKTKGKMDERKIGVDLWQGSMNHVPVSNSTFLATVCLETLVHADNLEQTLRELARITRPDGLIICNVPTSHTLPVDVAKSILVEGAPRALSRLKELLDHSQGFASRTSAYLPREIERTIRRCDLRTVEKESFAFGLYTFLVLQKA